MEPFCCQQLLISKAGRIINYLNHLDSRLSHLGHHKHASNGMKQLLICREDGHLEPHEDNNYWIHLSWYTGDANDKTEGLLLPGFWVAGLQMADLAGEERWMGWEGSGESSGPVSRVDCHPSTCILAVCLAWCLACGGPSLNRWFNTSRLGIWFGPPQMEGICASPAPPAWSSDLARID